MEQVRKPLQGVWNIIRFNWHFFAFSLGMVMLLAFLLPFLAKNLQFYAALAIILVLLPTFVSLAVSCYVYDFSNLYTLEWIELPQNSRNLQIANIHAGFDETSILLKNKFPSCELSVFDFYDAEKHTEISIKRARKAYPPFPNTHQISTQYLPLADNSMDVIFAILAAHEIRNEAERIAFFAEIKRVLKPNGQLIVVEHLQDTANLFAYNIGFLHFHTRKTWDKTFENAGFSIQKEMKITPFISTFTLQKNGTTT